MPKADPSSAGRVSPQRIIAVDPGTVVTGYGVLEQVEREVRLVASGVIETNPRHSPERKLELIHRRLTEIISGHRPILMVLEEVFYHRNFKTALKLGEVRGVCRLAAAQAGIKVAQYAPRRVKKAVVGHGAAAKQQVQKMVQVLLRLPASPLPYDVSDALALGLTYFQDSRRVLTSCSGAGKETGMEGAQE